MNFKSSQLDSNTSLLITIGTVMINTILPMRNKLIYSCGVKICASGFNKFFESILCLLLVMEAFSLQKVVEIIKEVVVGERSVNVQEVTEYCR